MRLVNFVVAIALVFVGIGFVRPQAQRLSEEAWDPVVAGTKKLEFSEQARFDITESGEYVVFLEGPVKHPQWYASSAVYIDVFDTRNNRPIPTSNNGIDYAFDHGDRHSEALVEVRVQTPGTYRLHLGQTQPRPLVEAGFSLALCRSKLVDDQSLKSKGMKYGGYGVLGVLGIIALSMLAKKG